MTKAPGALPPQAKPVTDDGGIVKIVIRAAPEGSAEPRWEKGSNTRLHFVAYTFAPEQPAAAAATEGGRPGSCAVGHDHSIRNAAGGSGGGCGCCAPGRFLAPANSKDAAAVTKPDAPPEETPSLAAKRKIRDTRDPEFEGATEPGKPFDLRMGRQFMVPALELAVKSMRVGERAKFLVMPEYAEGFLRLETLLRKESKRACALARGAPLSSLPQFRRLGCAAAMSAELAEPENWDLANLASAPLELDVELLEVQEDGQFKKEIWEMPSGEKWREACSVKEQGGEFYRAGNFVDARESYTRALGLLESLAVSPEVTDAQRDTRFAREQADKEDKERRRQQTARQADGIDVKAGDVDAEKRSVATPDVAPPPNKKIVPMAVLKDGTKLPVPDLETLTRQCRLNYAACCLRLDRDIGAKADLLHQSALQAAVEQCTKVLQEEPRCTKALFRRAQAYSRIGRDLDLAERDFVDIVEKGLMKADDPELVAERRALALKARAAREKEKRMFHGVFS